MSRPPTARATRPHSPSGWWVIINRITPPRATIRSFPGRWPALDARRRTMLRLARRRRLVLDMVRLPPYPLQSCPPLEFASLVSGGRWQDGLHGASSGHVRGINLLLLDGSVTLVTREIDPKVWKEYARIGPPATRQNRVMREPALIFDFGNVVGFFDYLKVCERLGPKARPDSRGLPPADRGTRVRAASRPVRERQDRSRRIRRGGDGSLGLRLPYHEFVDAWQDIFWLNEPVARLIERLESAGYTLLLGSNTNILHSTHYRRQFASTLGSVRPSRSFARSRPHQTQPRILPSVCRRGGPAGRVMCFRGRPPGKRGRGSKRGPDRPALY